jgi:hypothetical protein
MQNTAFEYLYRDGGNNKNWGRVVFAGAITPDETARFIKALEDGTYFIAAQIKVPEVFLWSVDADYDPDDDSTYPAFLASGRYVISDGDHCLHEFSSFEATDDEPTDELKRSVTEFVNQVEIESRRGWKFFDPAAKAVARNREKPPGNLRSHSEIQCG